MYYNSDFSLNCEKSEFARCKQYINPQFCKLNCGFKYNMQVYIQLQYIKIPFWELEEVYCKKKNHNYYLFYFISPWWKQKVWISRCKLRIQKKSQNHNGEKVRIAGCKLRIMKKKNIIARQTQNCEEKVRILSLYLTFLKKKLSEFWVYISQFWLLFCQNWKRKKRKKTTIFITCQKQASINIWHSS